MLLLMLLLLMLLLLLLLMRVVEMLNVLRGDVLQPEELLHLLVHGRVLLEEHLHLQLELLPLDGLTADRVLSLSLSLRAGGHCGSGDVHMLWR